MLFGLLKNRKVKPAKLQKEGYKAMIPQDYLYWGKRVVKAQEDGVEFAYEERECFLGNTDFGRVSNGERGDAFAMKVLSGLYEGRVLFPEARNWDVFVKIPTGTDVLEYEILFEDFQLGDRKQDFYELGDIVVYAKIKNDEAKQKAMETAKKASVMQ